MKLLFGIIIVLVLSYWTIDPLVTRGFYPMHDDTQVARVHVMAKALKSGQFPVRWVTDLGYGYGYPIFNFYGPLPYYFGGWLAALGVDELAATKTMIGAGMLLAGVTMFILVYHLVGFSAGLIAGMLYVYAPYHAVQIYVRGAVGENWAYGFIPIIVLGFHYALYRKKNLNGLIIGSSGIALTILSHTLFGYLTVLLSMLSVFLILFYQTITRRIVLFTPVLILVCGLLLSSFFWAPALLEMKYTSVRSQIGPSAHFAQHFICPEQLWDSQWGYGGSAPGCIDGMSFKIGKLHIILSIIASLLFAVFMRRDRRSKGLFGITVPFVLMGVFLTLQYSEFIWETVPGMQYLQYPWRFLTIILFGISLVGAGLFLSVKSRLLRFTLVLMILYGCGMSYVKLFRPQYFYYRPTDTYVTDNELHFRVSKISDEYLPEDIPRPERENQVVGIPIVAARDPLTVSYDHVLDTDVKLSLMSSKQQEMNVNRAYFPGWEYVVNGRRQEPKLKRGFPTVIVPEGPSVFEAKFRNTPVRAISNVVSLVTFLILLYTYGRKTNP
jgi:hypothetical protein